MLFAPQMAQLLAAAPSRRPQAPAAPRTPRRTLLSGLRFPRRNRRAVAVGRLLRPAIRTHRR
jgi:hypothetical protein